MSLQFKGKEESTYTKLISDMLSLYSLHFTSKSLHIPKLALRIHAARHKIKCASQMEALCTLADFHSTEVVSEVIENGAWLDEDFEDEDGEEELSIDDLKTKGVDIDDVGLGHRSKANADGKLTTPDKIHSMRKFDQLKSKLDDINGVVDTDTRRSEREEVSAKRSPGNYLNLKVN